MTDHSALQVCKRTREHEIYFKKFRLLRLHFYVCISCSLMLDTTTPRTVAHQAPQSMEFSKEEYWSELPCPPPRDITNPEMEPGSPALKVNSLPSEPPGKPTLLSSYTFYFISPSLCILQIT